MHQVLRAARATAIQECNDIPNITSLQPRRHVTFSYREFKVSLKVTCLEEQVGLAFSCAVKGRAVETGKLMPIFAED